MLQFLIFVSSSLPVTPVCDSQLHLSIQRCLCEQNIYPKADYSQLMCGQVNFICTESVTLFPQQCYCSLQKYAFLDTTERKFYCLTTEQVNSTLQRYQVYLSDKNILISSNKDVLITQSRAGVTCTDCTLNGNLKSCPQDQNLYPYKNLCIVCPIGAVCKSGLQIDKCPQFQFLDFSNLSCELCRSDNFVCDGISMLMCYQVNADICENGRVIKCVSNSFMLFDNRCVLCSYAQSCVSNVITNCGVGKYLNQQRCENCGAGMFCDGISQQQCIGLSCIDGVISRCPDNQIVSINRSLCLTCPQNGLCDGSNSLKCYLVNFNFNVPYLNLELLQMECRHNVCPNGALCTSNLVTCRLGFVFHLGSCWQSLSRTADQFGLPVIMVNGLLIQVTNQIVKSQYLSRCNDHQIIDQCYCENSISSFNVFYYICVFSSANETNSVFYDDVKCKSGFVEVNKRCLCPEGYYYSVGICSEVHVDSLVLVECQLSDSKLLLQLSVICSSLYVQNGQLTFDLVNCSQHVQTSCACVENQSIISQNSICYPCPNTQICSQWKFKSCKENFIRFNDQCLCPVLFFFKGSICSATQSVEALQIQCSYFIFLYVLQKRQLLLCIDTDINTQACSLTVLENCSCKVSNIQYDKQTQQYFCAKNSEVSSCVVNQNHCTLNQIFFSDACICKLGYKIIDGLCVEDLSQYNCLVNEYLVIRSNKFICVENVVQCSDGMIVDQCGCSSNQYLEGLICYDCSASYICSGFERSCGALMLEIDNSCLCPVGYDLLINTCVENQARLCSDLQYKHLHNSKYYCLPEQSSIQVCKDSQIIDRCKCGSKNLLFNDACLHCPVFAVCKNFKATFCPLGYYFHSKQVCASTQQLCALESGSANCVLVENCSVLQLIENKLVCASMVPNLKQCGAAENMAENGCGCFVLATRNYVSQRGTCESCPGSATYVYDQAAFQYKCDLLTPNCTEPFIRVDGQCICMAGYMLADQQCVVDQGLLAEPWRSCSRYVKLVDKRYVCENVTSACQSHQKIEDCFCDNTFQYLQSDVCIDCESNQICSHFSFACADSFVLYERKCVVFNQTLVVQRDQGLKIAVIIIAVVCFILLLLIVVFLIWRSNFQRRQRNKKRLLQSSQKGVLIKSPKLLSSRTNGKRK